MNIDRSRMVAPSSLVGAAPVAAATTQVAAETARGAIVGVDRAHSR